MKKNLNQKEVKSLANEIRKKTDELNHLIIKARENGFITYHSISHDAITQGEIQKSQLMKIIYY